MNASCPEAYIEGDITNSLISFMATIVNNPGGGSDNGSGGWIIAGVIVIAVVLVAIFVWPGFGNGGAAPAAPTEVNVQIPTPDAGGEPAQ